MKNLSAKKVIYSILGLLFVILLFMGVKYLITSNSAEKEEFFNQKTNGAEHGRQSNGNW